MLIPAQKNGKKTVEQACTYIADFVYTENGQTVVEDTKGFKTRDNHRTVWKDFHNTVS